MHNVYKIEGEICIWLIVWTSIFQSIIILPQILFHDFQKKNYTTTLPSGVFLTAEGGNDLYEELKNYDSNL